MTDTPEKILQIQRDIIHAKTAEERFLIGDETIAMGRVIVESNILQKNNTIDPISLKVEVFKRYYGHIFSENEINKIIVSMRNYWNKQENIK